MLLRLSVVFAALAFVAPPASAGEVSVQDGVLVFVAGAGERNQLYICEDGTASGSVTVSDQTADLSPGGGCLPGLQGPEGPSTGGYVQCLGVSRAAEIDLGDGDDQAEVGTPAGVAVRMRGGDGADWLSAAMHQSIKEVMVDGGPGSDKIFGTNGDDELLGGPGDDHLIGATGSDRLGGGDGNDSLYGDFDAIGGGSDGPEFINDGGGDDIVVGGSGNDRLTGGLGADSLEGGDGRDTADYSGRLEALIVSLDGLPNDGSADERDAISTDVKAVETGPGDDHVSGSAAAETISTGAGADVVDPGGGSDVVIAGAGDDRISVRDDAKDVVRCDEGSDSATLDASDDAGPDCEVLDRPAAAQRPRSRARSD